MTNKERYINLLKQTNRQGIDDLINWLESTDFFDAPASTKYHNSKPGGLLEHSLNVFHELDYDLKNSNFIFPDESILIVSLLHDICKADFYIETTRNVKKDGKWYQEPYYSVDDREPLGHGEKSVILAMKYINLTDLEIAAIRWHMGGFESKENYNSISKTYSENPLALYLHIADLKATYLVESDEK